MLLRLTFLCLVIATGRAGSDVPRPRVALVLGGGGARGLAHVGVIRWLEEHRIPVDFVAGTSMGALVGGLYALGYSSVELQDLVNDIDWPRTLAVSPMYRDLSLRRKADLRDYPVRFEAGLKHGFSIPIGLESGHFIGLLLQEKTAPYSEIGSFDELPIPFRCVATDIETGEEVVLSSGPLWRALRATMAIPGAFTPIEYEGRLLVDGGVLNNVPADVGRQMGADIVIAVDVGTPLKDLEDLKSIVDILDQTVSVMMVSNIRRTLKNADLVIVPDLEGVETLDFSMWEASIQTGYDAAEARSVLLEPLALPPAEWQRHLEERKARRRLDLPSIHSLEVVGVTGDQADDLRKSLASHSTGPLRPESLEDDLTEVYSQGRYAAVGYEVNARDSAAALDVIVEEKNYGPPFVRFGLDIDGSDLDNVLFGVRTRATFFDVGPPRSEIRLDLGLGRPTYATAEYYVPVGGRFFLAPGANARRSVVGIFDGDNRIADYREAIKGFTIDAGYGSGLPHDEVRVGYRLLNYDGKIKVGPPLPSVAGTAQAARLQWRHDQTDQPVVPSSGFRSEVRYDRTFKTPEDFSPFTQVEGRISGFLPLGDANTVFGVLSGGTSFDDSVPYPALFSLGGPLRLGAYEQNRFRGAHYFYTSVGFLREISKDSLFFGGRTVVGGWYELGSAFDKRSERELYHVGSIGLIVDSLFGPVIVGSSWGESSHFKFYFGIGTLF